MAQSQMTICHHWTGWAKQASSKTSADTVVGLWPAAEQPLTLGGLLLFAGELSLVRASMQCTNAEMWICTGNTLSSAPIPRVLSNADRAFVEVIEKLSNVNTLRILTTDELQTLTASGTSPTWPPSDETRLWSAVWGSTLWLQGLHDANHGHLEFNLDWNKTVLHEAKTLRQTLCQDSALIVLHLKNQAPPNHESNANQHVWLEALSRYATHEHVRFVLIGNDYVLPAIQQLPSVLALPQHRVSLATQLALVETANGFMGMTSGPCNAAILSSRPYVLFKHPTHHAEQMATDLGDANRFSFARDNQHVLRERESVGVIRTFIESILRSPPCLKST